MPERKGGAKAPPELERAALDLAAAIASELTDQAAATWVARRRATSSRPEQASSM
jgi:hypothetical protein